jgi:hypothetical protein
LEKFEEKNEEREGENPCDSEEDIRKIFHNSGGCFLIIGGGCHDASSVRRLFSVQVEVGRIE